MWLAFCKGEGLQILAKIDNQGQYLRHANHPKVMDRYGWIHRFISASLCTLKASCKALVWLYTSNHLHVTSPLLSIGDSSWLGTWGWYSFFFSKRIEIVLHCLQAFPMCFRPYILHGFAIFATRACFPCWTSSSSLCRASSSSSALKICKTSSTFELVFS